MNEYVIRTKSSLCWGEGDTASGTKDHATVRSIREDEPLSLSFSAFGLEKMQQRRDHVDGEHTHKKRERTTCVYYA